jgi:hypothetical protein
MIQKWLDLRIGGGAVENNPMTQTRIKSRPRSIRFAILLKRVAEPVSRCGNKLLSKPGQRVGAYTVRGILRPHSAGYQ